MRTFFFIILITLFVACSSAPDKTVVEKTSLQPTPFSNAAVSKVVTPENIGVPVSVVFNNKELPMDGSVYQLESHDSVELSFEPNLYVNVFQRRNKEVTLLPGYSMTPQTAQRQVFISLKDIAQHTDWFVVTSDKEMSLDEQVVAATLNNFGKDAPAAIIKPVAWRLFTIRKTGARQWTSQFAAHMNVFQAPFSLEIFVKKPGEGKLQNFLPTEGNVPEGSLLQVRLDTHHDTHLGMFLCYMDDKGPKKIVRLFPPQNMPNTQEVKANTTLSIPSQDTIPLEQIPGRKVIYCFPTNGPLDCNSIEDWLTTRARGYDGIFSLEGEEVVAIGAKEEGVSRVEAELPHMRIDLEPEKK